MKKLAFLVTGVTALALGACSGSNQDVVNNAELNQPAADQLNAQANEAAAEANAEAAALANRTEQNAAADNTVNPAEAQEQNVSGM